MCCRMRILASKLGSLVPYEGWPNWAGTRLAVVVMVVHTPVRPPWRMVITRLYLL